MFKNIFKFILIFGLLFCLSVSVIFVSADTEAMAKAKNTAIDLTYTDMESLFADKIFTNEYGEIKLRIERDPELEELLLECKKKGLKFGLALGSGSARGLAHVGVIQVLEAYHIPVDIIAGTSIGSVVGSLYAAGASIDQLGEAALSIKKSTTLFLIDPALPHSGLISGKKIEEMLNDLALEDKTFDDLKIPFAAVATDVESGAEVILNQGKVIDAVRASISIPGIFTPVKYQDYYLVDGGVVDPVPVDVVQKMGADIIIAVSLAKISPYTTVLIIDKQTGSLEEVEKSSIFQQKIAQVKSTFESPNIFEVIVQSIDIMEAKITDQSLEGADVVIVPFGIKDINLFDFDKAEMLIKDGIMATMINMPEIKRAIKEKLTITE
ncbi:MAG: patatin-like phospholipase family protein [Candidatus Caldatribacteriota bacterium]|nr:patatin-like phospholipase family protein [Candidatus Caldatribacteriota bacterium]